MSGADNGVSKRKRVVLIQKWSQADMIWNMISTHFYGQDYQLVTVPLSKSPGTVATDDVRHVLHILDELAWEDAILVAHAADCVVANAVAVQAPQRVAGLFFVDLLSDEHLPALEATSWQTERFPTLVVSSLRNTMLTAPLLYEHLRTHLPGSELFLLEQSAAGELSEVFHAFCRLRIS